jgi:NADH:ubiquinone oxidoreductase subunit 4 (subunit M)
LLLKLGGYGIIRILLGPFKSCVEFIFPVIAVCCSCGVVYCALSAFVQIDLKKLIAYASISHMNFILIGLFSLNIFGIQGGIFMMLGHGLVSSLLFFLVGFFYDRHRSRNMLYFGGIAYPMPLFSSFFFMGSLANISFPLTCNFVGEFLLCLGIMEKSMFLCVFLLFFSTIGVGYTFFLFNGFIFSNIKQNYIVRYKDLTRLEFNTVCLLTVSIM